ncbi:arsinothricin resistance N-acetyltransferase ArsN1 family A [Saccharibacillus kuerlensis]|uniref:N-acetyltransferase n=1 Tax=Saccharibacillus kuerlensis TaxID=459527 RepID=A0ABQ2L1U9_9BACL|nr:arsinothricin resistance N-acetyltransferase ArsN1 family A [Saccharibacillus kuerlensis]GGN98287.1 N-acetyltransferase [Saccharibacillus kuerlensis]
MEKRTSSDADASLDLGSSSLIVRPAEERDLKSILNIYNEGIEDRIATLESEPKEFSYMQDWFEAHRGRYAALVAERDHQVVGWASLNPYSQRCAYDGVADLSVYIARSARGTGVGSRMLEALERSARQNDFRKIVLFTFPFNAAGQGLYRKAGYREVGIFEQQGILDGRPIDVMIMEKLLANMVPENR